MAHTPHLGFRFGNFEIRVAAGKIDLPGVNGWVGTWSIYRLPMQDGDGPLRYGDTGIQDTPHTAMEKARSIAYLVARSL